MFPLCASNGLARSAASGECSPTFHSAVSLNYLVTCRRLIAFRRSLAGRGLRAIPVDAFVLRGVPTASTQSVTGALPYTSCITILQAVPKALHTPPFCPVERRPSVTIQSSARLRSLATMATSSSRVRPTYMWKVYSPFYSVSACCRS